MTSPKLSEEGVGSLCFRQTTADLLTRRKLCSIGINSDSSVQSPLVSEGSLYFFLRFFILKPLIYGLGSRTSSICASTCRAGFSDVHYYCPQFSFCHINGLSSPGSVCATIAPICFHVVGINNRSLARQGGRSLTEVTPWLWAMYLTSMTKEDVNMG
jgi:hypothetical protein